MLGEIMYMLALFCIIWLLRMRGIHIRGVMTMSMSMIRGALLYHCMHMAKRPFMDLIGYWRQVWLFMIQICIFDTRTIWWSIYGKSWEAINLRNELIFFLVLHGCILLKLFSSLCTVSVLSTITSLITGWRSSCEFSTESNHRYNNNRDLGIKGYKGWTKFNYKPIYRMTFFVWI
jgi:hypothetical protein